MKRIALFLPAILLVGTLIAQTPKELGLQAISQPVVKAQLEFLASDWMEGRAAGTRGEYLAGDYIASMFKLYGIQPYGDELVMQPARRSYSRTAQPMAAPTRNRTYFQNIPMVEYSPGVEQYLSIISKTAGGELSVDFKNNTDFSVRTGSVGTAAHAQVAFAGYGFTDEKNGYDDYSNIDVAGKVVVILAGFPGHRDENSAAFKKFRPEGRYGIYMVERNKAARAEKLGAVAIIQISPGVNPSAGWSSNQIYPVKGQFYEADKPISTGGVRMALPEDSLTGYVPTFSVTDRVAQQILSGSGIEFTQFEKQVQESLKPASVILAGKSIQFKTTVNSRVVNARNVLGYIEGEKKDEVIVVGAHYDHMGKVDGWIWNGADDNASGTVGVMTIAKAFMASGKKPEKSLVFAAWTGEEKGLLGSKYFVKHVPGGDKVIMNLNYDMIARNEADDTKGNKADMVYTEAYKDIKETTVKNMSDFKVKLDLSYSPSAVPSGGSDHAPFAAAGIPIFYFMAAMHPDYHQPSDELEKINWEKMTEIIKIGFLNTWDFANRKE